MKRIPSHAHGKVILLGEHSVVYGYPALVAGIDRGATAHADPCPGPSQLCLGGHQAKVGEGELGCAFAALLAHLDAPPLAVSVHLDVPAGCGLGASAAIGVAIARAVLAHRDDGQPEDSERRRLLLSAANAWERVFHGNPSGIDAAASVFGGCLSFTRDAGPLPIQVARPLTLVVGVAAKAASTKVMVEQVAKRRAEDPVGVQQTLASMGALAEAARPAVEAGDPIALGPLLDQNQALLASLGVSTEALDAACALARESGALGAKLTGAGGGGCVVALVSRETDSLGVLSAWERRGISAFVARVGQASRASEGDEPARCSS